MESSIVLLNRSKYQVERYGCWIKTIMGVAVAISVMGVLKNLMGYK